MTSSLPPDELPEADPVDELLVSCLQAPPAERGAALAARCAIHPTHAVALRARWAFLLEAGLIEGPQALASTLPERIGGFRILSRLGQGGMGVVYLAEQERLGRRVALKLIQPGAGAPPRARERFAREVAAVSLLDHPNICQVHDAGEVEGVPYLAMRYVIGATLAAHIAQTTARRPATAADVEAMVAVGEQLAAALHAAHEKGLVHRDVKPGNVMLEAQTRTPVLLDFGLARLDDGDALTLSGDRIGTPTYMAPEQIAGHAVDRRTDVYALGATLYEAVTGQPPHRATTREALYRRILDGEITSADRQCPAVPKDLAVVLATALDRDPGRRYRTAAEFADDLGRVRRRRPILARPPGVWLRCRRWCQRNPYAATAICGLVGGLVTAFALLERWNRALAERDVELQTREVFDLLDDDPRRALELAWDTLQVAPDSPVARKALRAAVHAPQYVLEVPTTGKVDDAFDFRWDGSMTSLVLAWCEPATDGGHQLRVHRNGRLEPPVSLPSRLVPTELQFAPDGRRLAIAAHDAPAQIYDLSSRELRGLPWSPSVGPEPRSLAVAWHPREPWVVVGVGCRILGRQVHSEVCLYDLATPTGSLPRWTRPVGAWPMELAFARDGEVLLAGPGAARWSSVAAFTDHAVRAFDSASGSDRGRHDEHTQPCLELAARGQRVASVGHDGRLVLWELDSGRVRVVQLPRRILTVDIAPDGESLVTACADGRVRIHDWQGRELAGDLAPGTSVTEAAVFRPDGRAVLVQHVLGRELRTLDGRLLARFPGGHGTERREFFLGEDHVITADYFRVRVWQLGMAGLRTRVHAPGSQPTFSRSGGQLGLYGPDRIELLDRDGGVTWSRPLPAPLPATWPAFDDAGRGYVLTDDRQLLVVGPDGRDELVTAPATFWTADRLGVAPDGNLVAFTANWEFVHVLRRDPDGRWRRLIDAMAIPPPDAPGGRPRRAQRGFVWLDPDGPRRPLLLPTQRGLVEFELVDEELRFVRDYLPDAIVNNVAVSSDQRRMVLYTMDRELRRFDRRDGRWLERGPPRPYDVDRVAVAFDAAGRILLTLAAETRVLDWDLTWIDSLPAVGDTGQLLAHRLPDATRLVTVGRDHVLREWWTDFTQVVEAARCLLAR